MAYRREDIERVRDATDLVELVSEVTKVKRSGRSVMAVCPFHQEKTASMSIDPARGLYHCFGCEKSGDIFRFVQETQTLDFSDAVELLARRSGITLQRDPDAAKRRDRRQVLVDATAEAVRFYHSGLKTAPDAGNARKYLRGRGYGGELVEQFQMGYSPMPGDALVGHLRGTGVPDDIMVTAGLAIRARTGRVFDRFRGRIMFPIHDVRGDAVGFGARLLDGDGPKYLNSPETPIYHKSQLLYGLNWAKSEIVRGGEAVVVEGYTDVIALHIAKMPIAVATCGTALGEEHLDLLRRFTEKVVLMFDADEAGVGASLRGFERSVPGDLDLRVAALPQNRDPADVVAAGDVAALAKALESSTPLLQFRIERELERFRLDEPEARGRAVRAVAAVVARHPDRVTRHEYAVFVSRRTGVDLDVVVGAVEAAVPRGESGPARSARPSASLTGSEKAELEVLRLLLANDPGVHGVDLTGVFSRADHLAAYELVAPTVAAMEPGEPPDLGSLLGDDDSDAAVMLRGLAFLDAPLPDADEVVRKVQVGALDRRIQELRLVVEAIDADAEPEAYSARFQELIALDRQRRDLWSHD
ncbi:MAG: DNA primase [Actinobacteria bacterium RBG_16_68_21]|nr:MAG: DNA primase [Actinobacteria bacterium RBG_16_68_21]